MLCWRSILVFNVLLLVSFSMVGCSVRSNVHNNVLSLTSAHPSIEVPQEFGLRPTLAGEGLAIAHAVKERNVATTGHSSGTILLLRAAGAGWALPNIRALIDHEETTAMTTEERWAFIDQLQVAPDPWPGE
ncbi:hypothetical protein RIEGSTA812A_PEG_515 [invertebrate metagenome]|uniref:Lipoprotein n=1 Tax=invertebrate metagenome TaxID=1711999 RepID=A0A484HB87_9ZZZZ